jgi:hypothetical protein
MDRSSAGNSERDESQAKIESTAISNEKSNGVILWWGKKVEGPVNNFALDDETWFIVWITKNKAFNNTSYSWSVRWIECAEWSLLIQSGLPKLWGPRNEQIFILEATLRTREQIDNPLEATIRQKDGTLESLTGMRGRMEMPLIGNSSPALLWMEGMDITLQSRHPWRAWLSTTDRFFACDRARRWLWGMSRKGEPVLVMATPACLEVALSWMRRKSHSQLLAEAATALNQISFLLLFHNKPGLPWRAAQSNRSSVCSVICHIPYQTK